MNSINSTRFPTTVSRPVLGAWLMFAASANRRIRGARVQPAREGEILPRVPRRCLEDPGFESPIRVKVSLTFLCD
jgi:hypothetical protein